MTRTPEYQCWTGLINRCHNPSNKSFHKYGARGIFVCDEWRTFEKFFSDMGRKPGPEYSIERRDNDGPYFKENCFWATLREQASNRRSTHLMTLDGETACLSEWARRIGITPDTLERRVNLLGWSDEKALKTPLREWGPGRPKSL